MKEGNVKVAVVIPVYNGESVIENSIHSLKLQTFNDWVAIIVNDGSTDKTKFILDNINDERLIIIHLEENRGRGFARQIGLEKIKELEVPYMCMLDADDLYYSNKLEDQFLYMEENPNISLASYSIGLIDNNFKLKGVIETFDLIKSIKVKKWNDYIFIPHASSIIRVQDINDICYDYKMKFSEDQDFIIRFLIGKNYVFIPRILYLYNRENSSSLKKYILSSFISFKIYFKVNKSPLIFVKLFIIINIKILIMIFVKAMNIQHFNKSHFKRLPSTDEEKFHVLEMKK